MYQTALKIVEIGEIEKKNPRNLKGFRNPLKAETSNSHKKEKKEKKKKEAETSTDTTT